MNDQRREITLSVSTAVLLICLTTAQCEMQKDTRRIARTLDAHLCIEAARVGVQPIPDLCQKRIKDQQ